MISSPLNAKPRCPAIVQSAENKKHLSIAENNHTLRVNFYSYRLYIFTGFGYFLTGFGNIFPTLIIEIHPIRYI